MKESIRAFLAKHIKAYNVKNDDDIFALDAVTGKKIWEYNSDIPQVNTLICCTCARERRISKLAGH